MNSISKAPCLQVEFTEIDYIELVLRPPPRGAGYLTSLCQHAVATKKFMLMKTEPLKDWSEQNRD
ncbi:hypothetical protein NRF20_41625 [Streptomyces sp. R-74717]|uniref:hypothetical protein n=1 Tax=Streptomyces TaxID=1883 RepID=UPI00378C7196